MSLSSLSPLSRSRANRLASADPRARTKARLGIEGLEVRRMMSHVLEPVQLSAEAEQSLVAPAAIEAAEDVIGETVDTAPSPSVAAAWDGGFTDGSDFVTITWPDLDPVLPTPDVTVEGRHVFYNNSAFDGENLLPNASDDEAIATDKTALLPGNTATFDNYTSYSRGINGVMVDIDGADLSGLTTRNVSDYFEFHVGNDADPDDWSEAPAPRSVTVREGAGENGSDRVTIIWRDGTIRNEWLDVRVLAEGVGLETDDVFRFGNAVGEAGNSSSNAHVTATDLLLARNNQRSFVNPAPVDFDYDFNRDQRVNATDVLLARNNAPNFMSALSLVDLPDLDPPSDPPGGGDAGWIPFDFGWLGGGMFW